MVMRSKNLSLLTTLFDRLASDGPKRHKKTTRVTLTANIDLIVGSLRCVNPASRTNLNATNKKTSTAPIMNDAQTNGSRI